MKWMKMENFTTGVLHKYITYSYVVNSTSAQFFNYYYGNGKNAEAMYEIRENGKCCDEFCPSLRCKKW